MRHGKILLGEVLIVFALIVLTIWGATQWTAHMLGDQPGLGRPWFFAGELAVYKPWRLFQWWYAYEGYAPDVFARAGLIASSGGLLGHFALEFGAIGSMAAHHPGDDVSEQTGGAHAIASRLRPHHDAGR